MNKIVSCTSNPTDARRPLKPSIHAAELCTSPMQVHLLQMLGNVPRKRLDFSSIWYGLWKTSISLFFFLSWVPYANTMFWNTIAYTHIYTHILICEYFKKGQHPHIYTQKTTNTYISETSVGFFLCDQKAKCNSIHIEVPRVSYSLNFYNWTKSLSGVSLSRHLELTVLLLI